MQVFLANPRGFCAGVDRAIEIVERALEIFGAPVYVRHEVVHNRYVVDGLRAKGAVFVEELDAVPDGATVIFSAHGVPRAVEAEAKRRGLRVFDATCPLVTKVHMEVIRQLNQGLECILIGHAGHPEVIGTMGEAPEATVLGHGAKGGGRPSRDDLDLGRRGPLERRGGVVTRLLGLLLEPSGGVGGFEPRLRCEPEVERDHADEFAVRRPECDRLAQGLETVG